MGFSIRMTFSTILSENSFGNLPVSSLTIASLETFLPILAMTVKVINSVIGITESSVSSMHLVTLGSLVFQMRSKSKKASGQMDVELDPACK